LAELKQDKERRRLVQGQIRDGSNGSRMRLWKIELPKLADEPGVPITVCHSPPGTASPVLDRHRQLARQTVH